MLKKGSLLLLSLLLLCAGIWIVGADKVFNEFSRFPVWVIAVVLTMFAINLAVVSFRLNLLLKYFYFNMPYSTTFKASLQGHFTSLFFISLFGQVAGRQMVLRKYGTPPVFIAFLTAIERVVLFVVSGVFCLLGTTWILDSSEITGFLRKISFTQMFLVAIMSFVASLWYGRSKLETRLLTGILSKHSSIRFLNVFGISFAAQSLVLSAFVIAAMSLSTDISFWNLLAAAAITSFAASLPISVNGWGIREIAAIYAFGNVGIPPSSALAISILVGLCSTAVVLTGWPMVLNEKLDKADQAEKVRQAMNRFPVEKTATWGLVAAANILIFFQLHLPLHGGVINLNLADPFAILALASVITHSFYTRQLPRWVIPRFNLLLFVIGILLLIAFLVGVQVTGVTQWALAGRIFGWLVLVGYLSVGILSISYLGRLGIWRSIETLTATAVVVILFHAVMRWLVFSGWVDSTGMTLNFEGFSGNRNAFAFQLLICSVLLLAYTSGSGIDGKRVNFGQISISRNVFIAAVHGVILAGLVFTGSRAGMLTGLIILFASGISGFVNRRMMLRSVIYGFFLCMTFVWLLPWFSQLLIGGTHNQFGGTHNQFAVPSTISHEMSNIERWETIFRGFDMWRESPWFGGGLGVFVETSTQWFEEPIIIHSTPVWILAEFGLFGIGVMLTILLWMIIAIMKTRVIESGNRAVLMLLAVFLIFGLVHEIFYQRIFWLALGICLALPFRDIPQKALLGEPKS
ncbi:MAG: hypothetical protein GKR94_02330 [Gammaproteobacteria bacterium]|nr:hypothetical protein [Gammaproteobacteria bacterium]